MQGLLDVHFLVKVDVWMLGRVIVDLKVNEKVDEVDEKWMKNG